jgi:hypothetical protein
MTTKKLSETGRLLESAAIEIKILRQQNETMRARLDMFDKMMMLFDTCPSGRTNGILQPDLREELMKMAESIKHENVRNEVYPDNNDLDRLSRGSIATPPKC